MASFDPELTSSVINATSPDTNPRLKQLVGGLVQHIHDYMRENLVTLDELMAAIHLVDI